jgi:UDP-N-acetylglucosamine 2-epimerase
MLFQKEYLFTVYHDKLPSRVELVNSMDQARYLSAMKNSRAVIGNSSIGIIGSVSFNA